MKYDWVKLEEEFLLSDYKTVSAFLRAKGINRTGTVNKQVGTWKEKKAKKEQKKSKKIIEEVIQEEIKEEVKQKVKINDVAQNLLEKINKAVDQLNINTDMFGKAHKSEIINRADIKKLTSALKDLSDISKYEDKNNGQSKGPPTININVVDNSKLEEDLWRDFNENNKQ